MSAIIAVTERYILVVRPGRGHRFYVDPTPASRSRLNRLIGFTSHTKSTHRRGYTAHVTNIGSK